LTWCRATVVKDFFQIAAIILCTRIWQLVNMTFVAKLKKSATETFNLLRELYGGVGRCTYCTLAEGIGGMLLSERMFSLPVGVSFYIEDRGKAKNTLNVKTIFFPSSSQYLQ